MKKHLCILLILAMLVPLMSVNAGATDKATIQKALTETALAYYYKETQVQYDSYALTYQPKSVAGANRISSGSSPEMAAADNTVYTVCSDFCSDVYYTVFGQWICNGPRLCYTGSMVKIPASAPEVVVKFGGEDGMTDRSAAIAKARKEIQPGDLIVYHSGGGGHAMMYIGDAMGNGTDYLIHSGGDKINVETGMDRIEDLGLDAFGVRRGSIRLNEANSYCFTEDSTYGGNLYNPKKITFCILRPWQADYMPKNVLPSALSRIQFPRIEIDRSADRALYNTVTTGEEMSVTVTVKNNGSADYKALTVSEKAPTGAVITAGSANEGGSATASGVSWRVNVPAGSEKKLTYRVKITAEKGETVFFPAGLVAEIPTRELSFRVGGAPLPGAKFADILRTEQVPGVTKFQKTQLGFANEFYKKVLGADPALPETLQEVLDGLFVVREGLEDITVTGGKMLSRKAAQTPQMQVVEQMLLPKHVLGRAFLFETDVPNNYGAWDRVLELKPDFYEPGDIFVGMRGRNVLSVENPDMVFVYIYLGDGKVLTRSRAGKPVITDFDATAGKMLRMNLAFVLRPSLV